VVRRVSVVRRVGEKVEEVWVEVEFVVRVEVEV
jgi:hypothetical protein